MRTDYRKLDDGEFGLFVGRVRAGDDQHQGEPSAFAPAERERLNTAAAGWETLFKRIKLLEAERVEFKQTRDEKLGDFRQTVRAAREWVVGQFERGDEMPGLYGLAHIAPRSIGRAVSYGQILLESNAPDRELDPPLPDWLLTPIQDDYSAMTAAISAYDQKVAELRDARAERNVLRKEIHKQVRSLRQYLYARLGRDSHQLADYGF